jgi:hypothetical protein
MAGRPANSTKTKTTNNTTTKEKIIAKEEVKNVTKKRLKFDDNVLISIKSNVFGKLIYINHKTGDKTVWENFGDTQPLSVADLRAMKGTQLSFFKENWITIECIEDADSEFNEVEPEEIYDALQITQYYKDYLCPQDINMVFNWSVNDIKNKVPRMTKSVKESIAIRANELIKEGILDSISKLKALEEVLGCNLASPDDEE